MLRPFTLFIAILLSTPALAEKTYGLVSTKFKVEHETEPAYILDALVGRRYSEWGFSGYFMLTQGWAQAYAGPTYAPAEWIELSLNIGAQHSEDGLALRYAATVWFGYKWFEFLGIVEFDNLAFKGNDVGVLFDLTATTKNSWIAIGFKVQRGLGFGPYFKLSHEASGLSVWLSWASVDLEPLTSHPSRFMVGATLSL